MRVTIDGDASVRSPSDTQTAASTSHGILAGMEPRARGFDTVVLGGVTAGVLDILDAVVLTVARGGRPARMLQGIASGLLGPGTFEGGALTAALGLALHFVIALGAAAVYFLTSRKLPVLIRRPVVCGIAFGLCVWAVMQYVVLPLSLVRGGGGVPPLPLLMNQLLIHAFGVGLPIALFASRSASRHLLRLRP